MDLLRRVFAAPARTYFNFGNPILVMGLSQISIRDTKIIACFTGRERPESLTSWGANEFSESAFSAAVRSFAKPKRC